METFQRYTSRKISRIQPGIEPGTSWMAVSFANHYTKQAVNHDIYTSKFEMAIPFLIFNSDKLSSSGKKKKLVFLWNIVLFLSNREIEIVNQSTELLQTVDLP